MEEKKIIGMPYYCVLALTWLLFPFGIVALAVDHAKMNREEKQYIVQSFCVQGIFAIISTVVGIVGSIIAQIATTNGTDASWWGYVSTITGSLIFAFMLVMMILTFMQKLIKLPLMWHLAGAFLPNNDNKEEVKEDKEV